jgi:PmbA protein
MYEKDFEKLFDLADGKVDDIEISLSGDKSFSVSISKQNVESFKYADSKGIGIRIIKAGKVGYAYTEEFSEAAFSRIIDEAVANSELIEGAEPVVFANHPDVEDMPDIYNEELEKVDVRDKIALAKKLEADALAADKRVFNVPYANYSDGFSYSKIVNSKGLNKEAKTNYCMSFAMVLAQENEDKKSGSHFAFSRDFNKIDPSEIVAKAVTRATDLLNGKSPGSGEYPVVFDRYTASSLLGTFSGIFSAKNIQEGKSLLKGLIGKKIANDLVTIVDDGLHPEGVATTPFDSEGYPSQRTILVDKGILSSYLHNTTTALIDNVKSTGNASRAYKSSLTVSPTNFILEAGNNKIQDLYRAHDKVIEIVSLQGLHSGANPVSGDFSLSAEGFLYEKGERKNSLVDFTISGNFIQLLNDIEMIADDFFFSYTACGTASILVNKLSISSK